MLTILLHNINIMLIIIITTNANLLHSIYNYNTNFTISMIEPFNDRF